MKKLLLVLIILLSQISFAQKNIDFDNLDYEGEIVAIINETPIYVNLKECLYLALLNNSYLKSKKSIYESKKYDYKYSIASFLPDAGLRGYIREINGQLLVGGALVEDLDELGIYGGLYVRHDLTNAGRAIFEMLSRKNLKIASEYNFKGTKQQLLFETAKAYYELILTKLIVHNLLIAMKDRTYQLEISKARYEVGEVEKLDVLRSETEVQQTRIELLSAVCDFQLKQTRLARIIGVDTYSPLFPIEKDIKEYNLIGNLTRKEIIDNAMDILPSIKSKEEEIKSLKKQRLKLFSDIFPNASLDFETSYQGTARLGLLPNLTFLVNVDIPLGDKLYVGTWAKIKSMDKQIEAMEYELRYLKTEVKENIIKSFFNSEKSRKEIIENQKQFEITKRTSDIATGKYFEGEEELINVIHAQTNKTRTMINLSSSKINYNIDQLSIIYYGGLANVENILRNYSP